MLRIGVLLPRSSLYPSLNFDFLNGLNAYCNEKCISDKIIFITDNIGFGVNEQEIYTKAEKFLISDNVDIVIAFCDSKIASLLSPLFIAANKLLIVSNFGANLPENWNPTANVITYSLNFCMHSYLTGKLAVQHKTAAMAASFYDAGYNQVYCMVNQFLKEGGQIMYNHVTDFKVEVFTIDPLIEAYIQKNKHPNLLCLFSADMAELFYRKIATVQQQKNCNLFVSPMMLDEGLIELLFSEKVEINCSGYTAWHTTIDIESNKQFIKVYQNKYKKQPNIFSTMGWDLALLLEELLNQYESNENTLPQIINSLYAKKFDSPRGEMQIDVKTNFVFAPSWFMEYSSNKPMQLIKQKDDVQQLWETFTKNCFINESEIFSAWRNTYLCI